MSDIAFPDVYGPTQSSFSKMLTDNQVGQLIEQYPWQSLALAVAAGYVVIRLTSKTRQNAVQQKPTTAEQTAPSHTPQISLRQLNQQDAIGVDAGSTNYPSFNPLANLNIQERTGTMNPVMWNKTTDVRGEPKGVRLLQMPVESSFLKNPKGTEARLDELDIKDLRRERTIEY